MECSVKVIPFSHLQKKRFRLTSLWAEKFLFQVILKISIENLLALWQFKALWAIILLQLQIKFKI